MQSDQIKVSMENVMLAIIFPKTTPEEAAKIITILQMLGLNEITSYRRFTCALQECGIMDLRWWHCNQILIDGHFYGWKTFSLVVSMTSLLRLVTVQLRVER